MGGRKGERRRSHESFRRTLARIAGGIAGKRVYELEWDEKLLHSHARSRIRIEGLWVAGSFARGAPDCGDLDLILDVALEDGFMPWESAISRVVLGKPPDVRFYLGTPEKNSSGVSFPEARLIWSAVQPDWEAALAAIKVDPAAGRFARESDEIPLRSEQILVQSLSLTELVERRAQGIIDWRFIPTDEIPLRRAQWPPDAEKFAVYLQRVAGKKSQAILEFVIEYLRSEADRFDWRRNAGETARFQLPGIEIVAGRAPIDVGRLDALDCHRIVVAPHISHRGPNGLWILSRGQQHPLEISARDRCAYLLMHDGEPLLVHASAEACEAWMLELFSTAARAQEAAMLEAEDDFDCEVSRITGSELLRWISSVDVVELDATCFSVTATGRRFCEDLDPAPTDDLFAALPLLAPADPP